MTAPRGTEPDTAVTPGAEQVAAVEGAVRAGGLWSDAWYDLARRPLFWASIVVLVVMSVLSVAPGLFTDLGPNEGCNLRWSKVGPGAGHIFGYDLQGCDYWSQVVHGARPSMVIGLAVTAFALIVSIILGSLSGYYGGWLDSIIARVTDIFFGLPFVLGATVVLVAFPDHGIGAMCLVLVLLGWTVMTRVMRGQVISVKDAEYVVAARALGAGGGRVMFRHILPNAIAPVFVVAMLNVGNIIAGEATLDYLGVGLQYPTVSWGLQLNVAQDFFLDYPHLLIFPAVFLSLTVLSFIMLGDAVRDALDPRLH